MKKVLIIDSAGMAGHIISDYLFSLNRYDLINLVYGPKLKKNDIYIDLLNQQLLKQFVEERRPEIIINCFRLLIEESEQNPAKAIYFNSFIPHYLEELCRGKQIKIIHLSTDCVFSGLKGNYNENDFKDGKSFYARTKALGEIVNDKDLTFRTSFIGPNVGERSEELFHWFMMQKGEINGYNRVFWTGITTLELAKSIDKAMKMDLCGLYHLVPNEKISKYELLNLIKKIWKRDDIIIKKNEKISLDRSLIDNRKKITVNNYSVMFENLFNWMVKHKELYKKYFKVFKIK